MKKTLTLGSLLMLLCIALVNISFAQQKQSSDPVKKLQQLYNSYGPKQEVTFEEFKKNNSRVMNAAAAPGLYTGCGKLQTPCDNGDFESGLDTSKWEGAYGTWGSGDPDPNTLTAGFISGDIFDYNAHQTIVGQGTDPNVGISTTNSLNSSSTQALRLGNAVNNYGTELLSKKIKVVAGQTIIKFSYAVVFEDPQHAPEDQPAFSVRVFDCATGQELTGVCNLGNGSNKAVSDRNNPFFQCSSTFGCNVIYRDWSTAQIDLSSYIGKTVNIEFLNKDCGLGGHYGYTYLDDFGTNGCVNVVDSSFYIVRNLKQTDSCGKGQVCVDYILPKAQGQTGEVNIDLNIYQNGNLLKTINSDTLRTDSSTYCFTINPATLGIDTTLNGFDYTLTGNFSISGVTLAPQTLGNPPDGQVLGANNDYYTVTCPIIGNNTPVFVYPPTPNNGATINVHPGETIQFTVKAKDVDAGDNVMLDATGVPSGATTTPSLPTNGNPVSTKFKWTPGAGDVGTYPVQFTATDNNGNDTTTTIIVQVTSTSCGDSSFRPFVYVYPVFTVANQAYHTIYKGYGQQSVVLVAVPRGGSGSPLRYKFKWDNGSNLPIRRVSPDVTTRYEVDITDASGCTAHASVTVKVVDVRCGANNNKVQVCVSGRSLCVDSARVDALIKGGAKLGSCATAQQAVTSLRTAAPDALKSTQQGLLIPYPNPARSDIRFKWNMNVSGNAKINIMDLQGRVIITQSVTTAGQSINISKLSNGVYMAQLVVDGKQLGMTRFTVSK